MGSLLFDHEALNHTHRVLIRDLTHKYKNRLAIDLERDHYLASMREFLERENIHYARVPIQQQNEVYYFFFNLSDARRFLKQYEELNPDH